MNDGWTKEKQGKSEQCLDLFKGNQVAPKLVPGKCWHCTTQGYIKTRRCRLKITDHVIWPESSCSRKPASRNRRHNGNRDWLAQNGWPMKKVHDLWTNTWPFTQIQSKVLVQNNLKCLLCYPSQCLISFRMTLDTIGVLRHRSFDESDADQSHWQTERTLRSA